MALKGGEFNSDALSNAVADFFSHSMYKQNNNKNAKEKWATGFDRMSPLNLFDFSNHALHYTVVFLSENGKLTVFPQMNSFRGSFRGIVFCWIAA